MPLYSDPSFYVSVFSSVCFIASEILPFIPSHGNGLMHTILVWLSKHSTAQVISDDNKQSIIQEQDAKLEQINKKISSVIGKLDNTKNLNNV